MSHGSFGYANTPVFAKPGGKKGVHVCYVEPDGLRGKWHVVVWDGDKSPSLYKGRLLVLIDGRWRDDA